MSLRDFREAVWEDVPVGVEPLDYAPRRAFMLEHVRPGDRVLDVGCGEGRFAADLDAAGARVVAVDVASEPLRRARLAHPGIDFRLLDGESGWTLDDTSFDVVWAGEVIEHVLDTSAWLSEVRRVLRPAGVLLVTTPANDRLLRLRLAASERCWGEHFAPAADHLRFYSRRTLAELVRASGFSDPTVRLRVGVPFARRELFLRAVRSRF
jgi:2-polyprenyl-3-methyl-5-hydroxy-6-metoxy-1,4-benzoquinol methylase